MALGAHSVVWLGLGIPVLLIILINGIVLIGPSTKFGLLNIFVLKINDVSVGMLGMCASSTCSWAFSNTPPSQTAKDVPVWGFWPIPFLTILTILLAFFTILINHKRPTMKGPTIIRWMIYSSAVSSLMSTFACAQIGAMAVNGAPWLGTPRASVDRGLTMLVLLSISSALAFGLVLQWERGWFAFGVKSSIEGGKPPPAYAEGGFAEQGYM